MVSRVLASGRLVMGRGVGAAFDHGCAVFGLYREVGLRLQEQLMVGGVENGERHDLPLLVVAVCVPEVKPGLDLKTVVHASADSVSLKCVDFLRRDRHVHLNLSILSSG